jgi:Spy/CpxP family protein refolding chaperone
MQESQKIMTKEKNINQKSNYKIITTAAALTAVIAIAGIAASTYAYRGDFEEGRIIGLNPEKNLAIAEAFENKDYNAWLEAVGEESRNRAKNKINEEDFIKLAEMHNLIKEGKFEEAKEIREELGLQNFRGNGNKFNMNFNKRMIEKNQEAREAIENNDFQAWLNAIPENCPARENITEDNFSKLVEAHSLMLEGKFEEAKEIREELGLKIRGGNGMMNRLNR